jgi:DNA primase
MDNIQEIKSKLSILEVVSGYVRVEKSGTQYKARCPFHNERTPSFYLSPTRGSYHCFGCAESGDIFKFVEKMESLEFKDALKILADRAGVTLSRIRKEDDSRMLGLMESARQFFEITLSESIDAKKYLHDRGLTDISIKNYKIGYTKNDWRLLFVYLMSNGFTDTECVESGLIIKTDDNKYYDRFRGRVMFPIRNISGATVGFTGRVLPVYDDGKSGKYVNTPETKLYHKSKILFNYDLARKFIADTREVILVEGQMDVIMSAQAGIQNVIAVSGTAFTEDQVNIIKRLADTVVLAFDNDAAGKKAAERAAIMCAYGGLQIMSVDIKEKDIADMVQNNPAEWQNVYDKKNMYIEFLAKNFLQISQERERINYTKDKVVIYLKAISSPLERDFAIKSFCRITGIDSEAIKSEVDKNIKLDEFKSVNSNNNLNSESSEYGDGVEVKIKVNKKDKVILDLNVLKRELKIEDDFILDDELPDEIIIKRVHELEKENLLSVAYYDDLQKEHEKIVYDEEHKKIIDKINMGDANALQELQTLVKKKK